jgi:hypothetical protein
MLGFLNVPFTLELLIQAPQISFANKGSFGSALNMKVKVYLYSHSIQKE